MGFWRWSWGGGGKYQMLYNNPVNRVSQSLCCWHFGLDNSLWWELSLGMSYRRFRSIPGLYLLDANSTYHQLWPPKNVSRHSQMSLGASSWEQLPLWGKWIEISTLQVRKLSLRKIKCFLHNSLSRKGNKKFWIQVVWLQILHSSSWWGGMRGWREEKWFQLGGKEKWCWAWSLQGSHFLSIPFE